MPDRFALMVCLLFSTQTDDVKLVGTAGDIRFVVVSSKVAKTDDDLRQAAHTVCGDSPICGVRFWVVESHAARRLPMTDDQTRNQIAAYTINKNSGVDAFTCKPTVDRSPPCTPTP